METVKPPRLRAGDGVGVISPSSPPRAGCIEGTVAYWESRGHPVKVGAHAREDEGGFLAGSAAARASDLNEMLNDPEVRLIVPSMGGKGSSHLLPLVDSDALRGDPKIVMGHSDGSVLATALMAMSGVTTFHGPTGMDFGRVGITEFSELMLDRAICSPEPLGELPAISERQVVRTAPVVEGHIVGGHLRTLQAIVGTPYAPQWDGCILFIEEIDCEYHDVDAALSHLKLAGVLHRIAGLVVGTCVDVRERFWDSTEGLSHVIDRACGGTDFPILMGVDLGHTRDKVTIPIGATSRLDASNLSLEIVEPGVV